ncbi:MAG: TIM barrel protein [Nanoarchaeota archaeon]
MVYIHVGLGVWHKDILREADILAAGLCSGNRPLIQYPSSFSAVELQLGSPTNLSKHIGKSYDPQYFSIHCRDARIHEFERKFQNKHHPNHAQSLEASVDMMLNHLRYRSFMGFHSSDRVYDPRVRAVIACDLSEPDNGFRSLSLTKYKNMMELANAVEADAFVFHPSAFDSWIDDLKHRKYRMDIFYDSFRHLMWFYHTKGFGFTVAIENLEFSKFPATSDELIDLWHNCSNIAQQEGVAQGKVKVCLDVQHMRHSLKIINEPGNYPRFSHTPGIDGLMLGFPNVHRKFAGTSYNWCWKSLAYDPFDILADLFSRIGSHIQVIHTAGNDASISETHGDVFYRKARDPPPYWALNHRNIVATLLHYQFNGAIIIEDHSGDLRKHIHSGEAMQRYIQEMV